MPRWFLAPTTTEPVTCDGVTKDELRPASGGVVYIPRGMLRAHGYQGGQVLVGLWDDPNVSPAGPDWTPQTVPQAQAHFQSVYGVDPTVDEVW